MSDLIKREDAIKAIKLWMDDLDDIDPSEEAELKGYNLGLLTAEREVGKIPAAEPKQGEWIYPTDIIGFGRCNNCKALWDKSLIDNIYFKYCPRCGARMKGAE